MGTPTEFTHGDKRKHFQQSSAQSKRLCQLALTATSKSLTSLFVFFNLFHAFVPLSLSIDELDLLVSFLYVFFVNDKVT